MVLKYRQLKIKIPKAHIPYYIKVLEELLQDIDKFRDKLNVLQGKFKEQTGKLCYEIDHLDFLLTTETLRIRDVLHELKILINKGS